MKIRKKIHITALFAVLFLFIFAGCDDAKDGDTKNGDTKNGDTKDTIREVEVSSLNIPPAAINLSVVADAQNVQNVSNASIESYNLTLTFKKGTITIAGSTLTPEKIRYAVAYLKKDGDETRTATELMTAIVKNIAKIRTELDPYANPATYATSTPPYWSYILQDLLISLPVPSDPGTTVTIEDLESGTEYEMIILASAIADGVVYTVPSEVITKKTLSTVP